MLKLATILAALSAVTIASADAAEAPHGRDAARTLALMEKVADWQLAHLEPVASIKVAREETRSPRSWQQGAFYAGLTALAERSESPRFRDAVLAHGRSTDWQLGDRRYHADDHVIGQSYLWAAAHGAGPEVIAPLRKRFDEILAAPPRGGLVTRPHESCDDRWCWCDALFMAPPVWIGLTAATGDQRYAEYAHAEFKATRDYLYDREEHLFYRDSRFFEQRDSTGKKLFWSRGNGWVFAGVARVLERLPASDPARPMYEELFKEMAAKLRPYRNRTGIGRPHCSPRRERRHRNRAALASSSTVWRGVSRRVCSIERNTSRSCDGVGVHWSEPSNLTACSAGSSRSAIVPTRLRRAIRSFMASAHSCSPAPLFTICIVLRRRPVDETVDRQATGRGVRVRDEAGIDAARVQRVATIDQHPVENAVLFRDLFEHIGAAVDDLGPGPAQPEIPRPAPSTALAGPRRWIPTLLLLAAVERGAAELRFEQVMNGRQAKYRERIDVRDPLAGWRAAPSPVSWTWSE